MSRVFLSYRRKDSGGYSGWMRHELLKHRVAAVGDAVARLAHGEQSEAEQAFVRARLGSFLAVVPLSICFVIKETSHLEPIHIWLAILAGHATRCVLSVIRFRQGKWRSIRVE